MGGQQPSHSRDPQSPVVQTKESEVPKEEESEDKLTEYEIFQKLQMKEQKADRKRVSRLCMKNENSEVQVCQRNC